ncbi:MAG: zf-TFIIB domain-containing protein [Candidatus Eremiobacterota bacterium]
MECSNCGAPLQELTGACIYCGASRKNKGDAPEITIVKVSDRDCPRCNIKLDTVCIPSDIPLYIERCKECKGLFFDPLELEGLISLSKEGDDKSKNKGLKALSVLLMEEGKGEPSQVKYVKCPVCKTFMNRKSYENHSGVTIDSCQHGIWLDGGELNRILRWLKVQEGKKKEEKNIYGQSKSPAPPIQHVQYYPVHKSSQKNYTMEIVCLVLKIFKEFID